MTTLFSLLFFDMIFHILCQITSYQKCAIEEKFRVLGLSPNK